MSHIPGPWKAIPQGGSSTVICPSKPPRNDTRIPAYAYDENRGHCIGYPFIEDDGRTRLDFVNFAHDDARLIAAAPEMLAALQRTLNWLASYPGDACMGADGPYNQVRDAIKKATLSTEQSGSK